jgi:hypothetical protein
MQKNVAGAKVTGQFRRLALTALAAAVVAIAGAAAIYVIHRTMPATGSGEALPSGNTARSGDQSASGNRAPPGSSAPSGNSAPFGNSAPSVTGIGPGGIDSARAPAPPAQPPVSLRPPPDQPAREAPEASARNQTATQGIPAKRPAAAAPSARTAPTRPAAAVRAPDARTQGRRGEAELSSRSAERVAPQETQGAALPRARPMRLAEAQQAGCADEGLISRLICNERVRLRFCRDRWNAHPDCMVEAPRNDP